MSTALSSIPRVLGGSALLWVASLAAPAEAKEAYQRVVPPEHVVPQLQKVVIVQAGNGASVALENAIAAGLRMKIGYVDGLPVADPGLRSDLIDATTAPGSATPSMDELIGLARDAGAQGVVVANADGKETAYENYTEDRKAVVIENGQSHEENWTVPCARRDVAVSWSATLFDGRDGASVVNRSDTLNLSEKDCDEKGSDPLKLASVDEVIGSVVGQAAVTFIAQWAPRWERVKFALPNDKASHEVAKLADDDAWSDVVSGAEGVLADDPYNAVATYYIGLALELNGRAEDAVAAYSFANRLQEDRVYQKAAAEARDRVSELSTLTSYRGDKPDAWDQAGLTPFLEHARSASAVAPLGQAAEIKGTGNKRTPVFASADASAAILVSVPGGTRVRNVKTDGEMVQVQLPDGQLGWVSAKLIH